MFCSYYLCILHQRYQPSIRLKACLRLLLPPSRTTYSTKVTGPYNHNQSYNEIPPGQIVPSRELFSIFRLFLWTNDCEAWQHNDRPSQSTASRQLHPSPETHGSRYNGPPSFDTTNQFPAPNYSQPQQVVVPPSTPALDEIARRNGNGSTPKRSLPDSDESGPKAKRAKSKPKSTGQPTAPATSAPGSYSAPHGVCCHCYLLLPLFPSNFPECNSDANLGLALRWFGRKLPSFFFLSIPVIQDIN